MLNSKKAILFLSAIDFKDKSIQVIKKTPEAYYNDGWNVFYMVARDNCPTGNYFYEPEINPEGLKLTRFYWPLAKLRAKLPRSLFLITNKLASILVVLKLAIKGAKIIRNNDIDVLYGYEYHGVLAVNILRMFGFSKSKKIISRFQGTFLNEMFVNKSYGRLLFNLDLILAIKFKSDLLIMTDDGTQGDRAILKIRKSLDNTLFISNGVDELIPDPDSVTEIIEKYDLRDKMVFLSVSRLVAWKRVERCIYTVNEFKKLSKLDFKYLILGEGDKKEELEKLVNTLGLKDSIVFVGAVKNDQVKNYLSLADYFLSMYDSSNVGNPLLEALRCEKIIVTLNNGDTGRWIKQKENGLIYNIESDFFKEAAKNVYEIESDSSLKENIKQGIRYTVDSKLYTWEARFKTEIDKINLLF